MSEDNAAADHPATEIRRRRRAARVSADRCATYAFESGVPDLVVARYQAAACPGVTGPLPRNAADLAEADRNHLWTAFGPVNVAVHELGVHVALGDTRTATRLGTRIDVSVLPAPLRGRRARIHLELATAAAGERADDLAVLHLLEAERVAPQSVARTASTRRLVGELLVRDRGTPGLRPLAARCGAAP